MFQVPLRWESHKLRNCEVEQDVKMLHPALIWVLWCEWCIGFSENIVLVPLREKKELICFLTGFTLWAGLPKRRGNREQPYV